MKTNRAYKFRIYPNREQVILFAKTFGCTRFVYNKMLEAKIDYYKETGKTLHNTPAGLKKEYEWLKEVDSLALANTQLQLESAYQNFFRDKSVGFPKFKNKKKCRRSYTTNNQKGSVRIEEGKIKLPKAGWVRIKQHRSIPEDHIIKSVTVSQEASGKYYASILTEFDMEMKEAATDPSRTLGLDYSSPHFYVDSNGNAADMPHYYRKAEEKLAREQRKLSRMEKDGKNYYKQKKRLAKAYEKIRNTRKDWQHKESRRLAEEYDMIAVEGIDYKAMGQSLKLGKSTYDNGFGQFRTMLEYKMAQQGKKVVTIDKWYPSSKTCHHCGKVYKELTLGEREWKCPSCGSMNNRDKNAAENIRTEGLRMIS